MRCRLRGGEQKGWSRMIEAIKRAAALYGLQLKNPAALFEFSEDSFDAITLWHVLEHVHDLHGYIEQLKRIIRPGGKNIYCGSKLHFL